MLGDRRSGAGKQLVPSWLSTFLFAVPPTMLKNCSLKAAGCWTGNPLHLAAPQLERGRSISPPVFGKAAGLPARIPVEQHWNKGGGTRICWLGSSFWPLGACGGPGGFVPSLGKKGDFQPELQTGGAGDVSAPEGHNWMV